MSHDTVVHRAVRPAVQVLARIGVAPDHLTALRFATALGAAAAFAQGRRGWVDIGAGLFLFSALLDRADGELARQMRRFSQHGHRYDLWADCAAGVLSFIGLGLGAMGGPLGPAALVLGLLAAAGVTTLFWQVDGRGEPKLPGVAGASGRVVVDPDDAMFAVPVLLWCFGADAVLWPAGTLTPVLALWMVLRAWVRRRRRTPVHTGRGSEGRRPIR